MKNRILISHNRLNELIREGACTVVDCRFDLADPDKGRAEWEAGHIPGAVYAHLDEDLASRVTSQSGRHPLPTATCFSAFLALAGWSPEKLLVAYDDGSNAISARMWWLMRYFGQRSALLDGGLAAWIEAGMPLESGKTNVQPEQAQPLIMDPAMTETTEAVQRNLESGDFAVLDARAGERYSGKVENLDTCAGHIPGALNRPFGENLDSKGRFKAPERLKSEFERLLGQGSKQSIVHSCGSGVTACHNLFAMELAGLGTSRLYPGSWSEWIRDPDRPVGTGDEP